MFVIPTLNTVVDKRDVSAKRPSQVPFLRRFVKQVKNVDKEWIEVEGIDLRIRKDQVAKIFGKDGGLITVVDGKVSTTYVNDEIKGEIRLEVHNG